MLILKQFQCCRKSQKLGREQPPRWQGKRNLWKPGPEAFELQQISNDSQRFLPMIKLNKNRFHEVPNHTLVKSGRLKKAEKENKTQPNIDSCIYYDCFNATIHETESKKFFIFWGQFNQKMAIFGHSFFDQKNQKLRANRLSAHFKGLSQCQESSRCLIQNHFCKNQAGFTGAIMWSISTETFKVKNLKINSPKRTRTRFNHDQEISGQKTSRISPEIVQSIENTKQIPPSIFWSPKLN